MSISDEVLTSQLVSLTPVVLLSSCEFNTGKFVRACSAAWKSNPDFSEVPGQGRAVHPDFPRIQRLEIK